LTTEREKYSKQVELKNRILEKGMTMKLICYLKDRAPLNIQPAGVRRDWMDQTSDQYAYRCLPLNIANMHGWEICCEETVEAIWNGGSKKEDIKILQGQHTAITHFGSGVLTFHVACVFRTQPGWNLMSMGPTNRPKRGIQALTGVIETDWAPYSFTMNWIFTEPNHPVIFQKEEPFCFFFPVQRGIIDNIDPVFSTMQTDVDLDKQHSSWVEKRKSFIDDLTDPNSEAVKQKWQRNYFQGVQVDGDNKVGDHQTKLRPKAFQQSE
jgi:hypothetical protein